MEEKNDERRACKAQTVREVIEEGGTILSHIQAMGEAAEVFFDHTDLMFSEKDTYKDLPFP